MRSAIGDVRSIWLEGAAAATERALRSLGDPRLALLLLAAAAVVNAAGAADPELRGWLDSPAYVAIIGAIVLTGVAGVAVRLPAAWREWRHPSRLPRTSGTLVADLELGERPVRVRAEDVAWVLRQAGYRVATLGASERWTVAGSRRGWSRLAALGSHLALVLLVVGAALGTALAEETRFGLFPGEQSLLSAPRPGVTAAMRFDRLDAEFDANGQPLRFDTHVTFIRDGLAVRQQVLQVNDPGAFEGYLLHAWTYGPAVQLRVEDLAGNTLFDGTVALDGPPSGSRAPFVELPSLAMTLGVALTDAAANELAVIVADDRGVVDSGRLRPGERIRLGDATVQLNGFTSYVTFLSRSDPGAPVLFAGAGLLSGSLAAAFWLPRRRVSVAASSDRLTVLLRGERFDDPQAELDRLLARLRPLAPAEGGPRST